MEPGRWVVVRTGAAAFDCPRFSSASRLVSVSAVRMLLTKPLALRPPCPDLCRKGKLRSTGYAPR